MKALTGVVEAETFISAARRLMSEEERERVVDKIAANPETGVLVPGTRGLRKMRIPLGGRGKRGGGRVIYWYHSEGFPAVLLTVFANSEAKDLPPDRLRRFAAVAAALVEELGAGS